MNIMRKWTETSLILRIVIGLILGVILGLAVPNATGIGILGDLFVGALRALAPVLVFFLVMHSLANKKDTAESNMSTVIILYLISTFMAAVTAVVAGFIFPSEVTLNQVAEEAAAAPEGIVEVLQSMLMNIVDNPVNALVNANYLGVLAWAVILGLALRKASQHTVDLIGDVSEALSTAIRWVINFAPFGILGLVFVTISETGLSSLLDYGHLIAVLVGCMIVVALVINPLIVFINIRQNPYPLVFKCLKDSGIMAFFTRSSAANIPVNMSLCERLGLDEKQYSVSIPLGATINMDGTSIMQGVAVIFIAQVYGMELTPAQLLTVIATAMIASIGTAGIPSVGLIMLAMVLTSVGLPTEGIALIMGIDRILDMLRTAVNITGDAVCTTIVSSQNKELDRSIFNRD